MAKTHCDKLDFVELTAIEINKKDLKICELKAQVEQLRDNASEIVDDYFDYIERYQIDSEDMNSSEKRKYDMMASLLASVIGTPAQCLAEIKAQAIDDAIDKLNRSMFEMQVKNKGWSTDYITLNGEFHAYTDPDIDNMWIGWQAALKGVKSNANQLHLQANTGE